MKTINKIVFLILIGIIVYLALTRNTIKRNNTTFTILKSKYVQFTNTYKPKITQKQITLNGQPIIITKTDTLWKEPNLSDTNAIVAAYFQKNIYKDTLRNDSILFVFLQDTITENKIKSRQLTIKVHPIIKHTPPVKQLLLGAGAYGNSKSFGVTFNAIYIPKHGAYGIWYDPFNKTVGVNAFFNIKFKTK